MPRKGLALFLCIALVSACPGLTAWQAVAGEIRREVNPKTGEVTYREINSPRATTAPGPGLGRADGLRRRLRTLEQGGQISASQAQQTWDYLDRYERYTGQDGEATSALEQITKDLEDKDKDPSLTLAALFDRLSNFTGRADEGGANVHVISRDAFGQDVEVRSGVTGQVNFRQRSEEVGDSQNIPHSRRIIRRVDPATGKEVMDAILVVREQGAHQEQKIAYNRKLYQMLKNIYKFYYEQPSLLRRINDTTDPHLKEEDRVKMRTLYAENQAKFREKMKLAMPYIEAMLKREKDGTLQGWLVALSKKNIDELKKEAQALRDIQDEALLFYNRTQLETVGKMVIMQMSSYLGQVTNAEPLNQKEASLDPQYKSFESIEGTLKQYEQGQLEGYSFLMRMFGLTKIDPNDPEFVLHDILTLASEAFAYTAYAAKAQSRLTQGTLTLEEREAALEESGQWMKLAQAALQTFEAKAMAFQLVRLKEGKLRDNMGLDGKYAGMKDQALLLAKTAREQHVKAMEALAADTKTLTMKQLLASIHVSYINSQMAHYGQEGVKERIRILIAKSAQMRALYIAREFDKVRNEDAFRRAAAGEKLRGNLYQLFLDRHIDPRKKAIIIELDALIEELKTLTEAQATADRARAGLVPLYKKLRELMARMGLGELADSDDLQREGQRLAVREARVIAAVSDFSAQMRIFDMVNELDLYIRNHASEEVVLSENEGFWSGFIKFKWMDKAFDFITGGFTGGESLRKKGIKAGQRMYDNDAFKALGENEHMRDLVLKALAKGDFKKAMDLIYVMGYEYDEKKKDQVAMRERLNAAAKSGDEAEVLRLSNSAAWQQLANSGKRAMAEFEAEKSDPDPFDLLDTDSFMTRTPDNPNMIRAQGVITKMFNHLQGFIMGYAISAAVVDTFITTALTLGLGTGWRAAAGGGRMVLALAHAMRAARVAKNVADMGKVAKMLRLIQNFGRFLIGNKLIVGITRYVGRMMMSWGINLRNTTGIAKLRGLSAWGKVKALGGGYWNTLKAVVKMNLIMGGASGFIQGGTYLKNQFMGRGNQDKSLWDAFKNGMIQGAAFGAKSGLFMIFSPFPATAFGRTGIGGAARAFGGSAGPMSAATNFTAKMLAPGSAFAKNGVMGVLGKDIMLKSFAARQAYSLLGLLDGTLKFMAIAEVFMEGFAMGSYLLQGVFSGGPKKEGGGTAERLSSAQSAGNIAMMSSWIFVPVHGMANVNETRQQAQMYRGLRRLIREGIRTGDIVIKNGKIVPRSDGRLLGGDLAKLHTQGAPGEQLGYRRSFIERLIEWKGGQGQIERGEQTRAMFNQWLVRRLSRAQLTALSGVDIQGGGGGRRLLADLLAGKKPAPTDPVVEGLAKEFKAAGKGKPGQVPDTLFMKVGADGKLTAAAERPKEGLFLELSYKDGLLSLARGPDGALSAHNLKAQAQVEGKAKGGIKGLEGLLGKVNDVNGPVRLEAGEFYLSEQLVSAAREALSEQLIKDSAWRAEILENMKSGQKEYKLTVDGETLTVSGRQLVELRDQAAIIDADAKPFTVVEKARYFKDLFGERLEWRLWKTFGRGRIWKIMTAQKLETRNETRVRWQVENARAKAEARAKLSPAERGKLVLEDLRTLRSEQLGGAQRLEALGKLLEKPSSPENSEAILKELASLAEGEGPLADTMRGVLGEFSGASGLRRTAEGLERLGEGLKPKAKAEVDAARGEIKVYLDALSVSREAGEPLSRATVEAAEKLAASVSGRLKAAAKSEGGVAGENLRQAAEAIAKLSPEKTRAELGGRLSALKELLAKDAAAVQRWIAILEAGAGREGPTPEAVIKAEEAIAADTRGADAVLGVNKGTIGLLQRALKGEMTAAESLRLAGERLKAGGASGGRAVEALKAAGEALAEGKPAAETLKKAQAELEATASAEGDPARRAVLEGAARQLAQEASAQGRLEAVKAEITALREQGKTSDVQALDEVLAVLKGTLPADRKVLAAMAKLEALAKEGRGANPRTLELIRDQLAGGEGLAKLAKRLEALKADPAVDKAAVDALIEIAGKDRAPAETLRELLPALEAAAKKGGKLGAEAGKLVTELLSGSGLKDAVKELQRLRADTLKDAEAASDPLMTALEALKNEGGAQKLLADALSELEGALQAGTLRGERAAGGAKLAESLRQDIAGQKDHGLKTVRETLELLSQGAGPEEAAALKKAIALLAAPKATLGFLRAAATSISGARERYPSKGGSRTKGELTALLKQLEVEYASGDKGSMTAEAVIARLKRVQKGAKGEGVKILEETIRELELDLGRGDRIEAAGEKLDLLASADKSAGGSEGTLTSFRQRLRGELTADEVRRFVVEGIDALVTQSAGQGTIEVSYKHLRDSMVADAVLQFANKKLVLDIKAFKAMGFSDKELAELRAGGGGQRALEAQARLDAAKEFFVASWERGVFGKMFESRIDKNGERVWDIPEKFHFRDAGGNAIKSFRKPQIEAMKEDIQLIAEGKMRIYDLLYSSGGKTLLGIVLVGFMEAWAKDGGKEGALYVTSNEDLVAQATEVYKAFFRGRKPSFEIISTSELMLRQAMAEQTGDHGPFETHEVFMDEMDQLGLETALSLGQYTGRLSYSAFDPLMRSMRQSVEAVFGDPANGVRGHFERFQQTHGHKSKLTAPEIEAYLKNDPGFSVFWKKFVREETAKATEQFRLIKSGKIMQDPAFLKYCQETGQAKEIVYSRMIEEYHEAWGTFLKVGVLESHYGSMEGWVDKVLKGAYEAASYGPEISKVYMRDPSGQGIIQFHNDMAHPSLDTSYRTALELREGVPMTLDFETSAIVKFRSLMQAARDAEALLIGASGTLPDGMRPFLKNAIQMEITRGGNDPFKMYQAPVMIHSGSRGQNQFDTFAKAVDSYRRSGKKHIIYGWVESLAKKDMLMVDKLNKMGVEVSVLSEPGQAYFIGERYMMNYKLDKNIPAFARGEVEVVLLVGQSGLRGLEAPIIQRYGGAEIVMYVMDSHKLPEANLSQVMERIGRGRVPRDAITKHILMDQVEEVLANRYYQEQMPRMIGKAAAGAPEFARAAEQLKTLTREALEKLSQYRGQEITEKVIRDVIRNDPNLPAMKDLYKDLLIMRRLRQVVGPEALRQASNDAAAMRRLLSDPAVMEIMVLEMRRFNEGQALSGSEVADAASPGLISYNAAQLRSLLPKAAPKALALGGDVTATLQVDLSRDGTIQAVREGGRGGAASIELRGGRIAGYTVDPALGPAFRMAVESAIEIYNASPKPGAPTAPSPATVPAPAAPPVPPVVPAAAPSATLPSFFSRPSVTVPPAVLESNQKIFTAAQVSNAVANAASQYSASGEARAAIYAQVSPDGSIRSFSAIGRNGDVRLEVQGKKIVSYDTVGGALTPQGRAAVEQAVQAYNASLK